MFPATYVRASLFDDEPEQLTLAAPSPRKPSAAKKPRVVRPMVPLKDFEDWLEFAESVLGREDIPEGSLIADFKRLSELSDYEDQLEIYMGMDPFYRLSERYPGSTRWQTSPSSKASSTGNSNSPRSSPWAVSTSNSVTPLGYGPHGMKTSSSLSVIHGSSSSTGFRLMRSVSVSKWSSLAKRPGVSTKESSPRLLLSPASSLTVPCIR